MLLESSRSRLFSIPETGELHEFDIATQVDRVTALFANLEANENSQNWTSPYARAFEYAYVIVRTTPCDQAANIYARALTLGIWNQFPLFRNRAAAVFIKA